MQKCIAILSIASSLVLISNVAKAQDKLFVEKVYFDDEAINHEYHQEIYSCLYSGITAWSDHSDFTNVLFEKSEDDGNWDIFITVRPRSWFKSHKLGDTKVGITTPLKNGKNAIIIASDNNDCEFISQTITHEVGHALGLKHTFDKNSVMFPDSDGSKTISNTDLVKVRDLFFKRN